MDFDYRELTTQILLANDKHDEPDCGECTATIGDDTFPTRCNCCNTTVADEPECERCHTTKPHRDEPGSRQARDLTFLRQQLRDALAAG